MMLQSLHTKDTRLISHRIIFNVLRTIDHDTSSLEHILQFCDIYDINDLESRLKVI